MPVFFAIYLAILQSIFAQKLVVVQHSWHPMIGDYVLDWFLGLGSIKARAASYGPWWSLEEALGGPIIPCRNLHGP